MVKPDCKRHVLSWLHLSDWHQKSGRGLADRRVIAQKLVNDIKERRNIHPDLRQLDFVVFSGDVSFSGKNSEFADARTILIDPIKSALPAVPFLFVPGNHDIDRDSNAEIPKDFREKLFRMTDDTQSIEDLMRDPRVMPFLTKPFSAFTRFANGFANGYKDAHLYDVWEKTIGEKRVAVFLLNSSWQCAQYRLSDNHSTDPCFWDYGLLRIGEGQLRSALEAVDGFDIGIVVMHHPLYWLAETEQAKFEQIIHSRCHLLLHGHEHRPRTSRLRGTYGDIVIIPAGASYNRRNPADPRNANAYSYGLVDVNTGAGTVFHRYWEEVNDRWDVDQRYWHEGRATFHLSPKKPATPFVRTALDAVQSKYTSALRRRPAKQGVMALRHVPVAIDGENFIRNIVQYKLVFSPGEAEEEFQFFANASKRILLHPNPNVRRQAYELINCHPFMTSPGEVAELNERIRLGMEKGTTKGLEEKFKIMPTTRIVDLTYAVLDRWEGVWFFELARFFESVSFSLVKSPVHEYETVPLGGFPQTALRKEGVLDIEKLEVDELCFPKQGYLVHWYPKAVKDTRRYPRAGSLEKPGRTKPNRPRK